MKFAVDHHGNIYEAPQGKFRSKSEARRWIACNMQDKITATQARIDRTTAHRAQLVQQLDAQVKSYERSLK